MKKTTQLMEELNGSDDINSFLSNNKDSLDRQDFARYLCELVKKKKMTKIEVISCLLYTYMDIRYLQEQDFQARIR